MSVGALALGGNQGRPLAAFGRALAALAAAGLAIEGVSSAYLTRAAGPAAAPSRPAGQPYWNVVARLGAAGSPLAVLDICQRLEAAAGRRRLGLCGARPLDLDLLTWGGAAWRHPRLVLPHPRLAERPFVLWPLCEVAPDLPLPGGSTPRQLLAALGDPLAGIVAVRRGWAAGTLASGRALALHPQGPNPLRDEP